MRSAEKVPRYNGATRCLNNRNNVAPWMSVANERSARLFLFDGVSSVFRGDRAEDDADDDDEDDDGHSSYRANMGER